MPSFFTFSKIIQTVAPLIRTTADHHREVLKVCLPLVLSLSAITLMEFTDRVFLANYSLESISAALPAGISAYLFIAFSGGVGGYAGVFIAQYTGRGDHRQVGSILWQGIYFSLAAGLVLYILAVYATGPLFDLTGHAPAVRELEKIYFSILTKGSFFHLGMITLGAFFSGRGMTRPVMLTTFLGVLINIPLDYALIFGHCGMPELGIEGAAIATVISWAINLGCLVALIFSRRNENQFGVFSRFRFDRELFTRLLRFGVPGALQFTLDIFAFTLFILLVGRIGTTELAATNIVLSISAVTFMPSSGFSQGVSILVGQALGQKKPDLAAEYVTTSCLLLFCYIVVIDLLFILAPDTTLQPFLASQTGGADYPVLHRYCLDIIKVVAAYLLFDGTYMLLAGALRGAGDTRFMMIAIAIASPLCLIFPVYFGITFCKISVTTAWLAVLLFVVVLFAITGLRFRQGKWRNMLVIEEPARD